MSSGGHSDDIYLLSEVLFRSVTAVSFSCLGYLKPDTEIYISGPDTETSSRPVMSLLDCRHGDMRGVRVTTGQ
jgi:hypothetical protein